MSVYSLADGLANERGDSFLAQAGEETLMLACGTPLVDLRQRVRAATPLDIPVLCRSKELLGDPVLGLLARLAAVRRVGDRADDEKVVAHQVLRTPGLATAAYQWRQYNISEDVELVRRHLMPSQSARIARAGSKLGRAAII